MVDREKAIKGLHCCVHTDGTNCVYCPYDNADEDCTALMEMDVLDLLKEQESKKVTESKNMYTGLPITHCPKCGISLDRYLYGRQYEGQINYCPMCGQAVKWE